jgi:hypothetical protein
MSDEEILAVLEKEFPLGVFITSNRQALAGTKWDLGSTGRRVAKYGQNHDKKNNATTT